MNAGWSNLIPQEKKYTPALAAKAASLLESGATLSATARQLHVSRASLRNWAAIDLTLKQAFDVFEANKQKAALGRERVGHFKTLAKKIVDNAKQGVTDPIGKAVRKPAGADHPESQERAPETEQEKLQRWWASDWTPHFEAAQARAEQEEIDRQRDVQGFWVE